MTAARRRTARVLTSLGALTLLSSALLVAQPASATDASTRFGAAPKAITVAAAPDASAGSAATDAPAGSSAVAPAEAPATAAPTPAPAAAVAPPETPPGQEADGPARGDGGRSDEAPGRTDALPVDPGLALPVRPCDPSVEDCRPGADQGAPALPIPLPVTTAPRPCDPSVSDCGGSRPVLDLPRAPLPVLPSRPNGAGGPVADDGGSGVTDGPTTGSTGDVVGSRARPGASADGRPGRSTPTCDAATLTCRAIGGGDGSSTSAVDRARGVVANGVSAGVSALARTGSPVLVLFFAGLVLLLAGGVLAGWAPRRPRHALARG